ncbi:MAG: hypothetical protein NTW61_07880 [Candidatus Melainabacteria bacterium]|jgi:hypothetical protein|nr:hypothetical protein [Candidatus Melainabacteria bacterium]
MMAIQSTLSTTTLSNSNSVSQTVTTEQRLVKKTETSWFKLALMANPLTAACVLFTEVWQSWFRR